MSTQRLARHNVVAVFDRFDAAMAALERLDDAGFDREGELSLLGPEHEMRPAMAEPRPSGGEALTGVGSAVTVGATAGAAGGAALVGLASTAVALPGIGLALGPALVYGLATGAVGGSVVGGLFGLETAGRRATMWQQTLSPLFSRVKSDGVVLLGVHVDDDDRRDTARDLLTPAATEVHLLEAAEDRHVGDTTEPIAERHPSSHPESVGRGTPEDLPSPLSEPPGQAP